MQKIKVPDNAKVLIVNPKVSNKGYSYAGASHTKRSLKGFTARSGSPNEDINWNNYTLRQRARMLTMSAPLAKAAITTNRTNVIGVGLKLKSKVNRDILRWTPEKAAEWQKDVEFKFNMWARDKRACDATGVNDFYEMQQLVFSSYQTNGDCFVIPKMFDPSTLRPFSLRLHVVEADRIRTPNVISGMTDGKNPDNGNKIYDGVEIDSNGSIVAYYISNRYPYELSNSGEPEKFIRVEAYGEKTGLPQVLQIMDSERADQYRGVTYLAPVIETLLQLNRYTGAELEAADLESCLTAWLECDVPDEVAFGEIGSGDVVGQEGGSLPSSALDDNVSIDPNEYEIGPKTINALPPGYHVTFNDPKRPSSGYSQFLESVALQIGAGLEVSSEILLKRFNSSYSASRGALLEAWKGFHMRRGWFASDFCSPVYELWLSEAVARGIVNAPGFFTSPELHAAYLGCQWIGPAQGTLNPVQEIQAEVLAAENGLTTRADAAIRLNGSEFADNISELGIEKAQMYESGLIPGGEDNA